MTGFERGQQNGFSRRIAELKAAGGVIPAPVLAAGADFDRVVAEAAQQGIPDDVRNQIANKLIDGTTVKPAEWAEISSLTERHNVYGVAKDQAMRRHISIVKAHADELIAEARRVWHTPAVEALTKTANQTTSRDTSSDLLRRNQIEAGQGLAMATVHLKTIREAIQFQRAIVSFPPNSTLSSWESADLPTAGDSDTGGFLDAIRAGNVPKLPTLGEFDDARQKRKQAQQQRDANRPQLHANRKFLGI